MKDLTTFLRVSVMTLCLALFVLTLEAKRPENRVPVSPKHYEHDRHQFSPFFDINLPCDTIQWHIEDPDRQRARFDIRVRRTMRIDQTILADLTDSSITPKPAVTEALYVSNVKKAKQPFTLTAVCAPMDDIGRD